MEMFLEVEAQYLMYSKILKDKGFFPNYRFKNDKIQYPLDNAASMVQDILKISTGGEIFVPKIKSLRVIDLAKTMNYKNKFKIIGMRPGETSRTNDIIKRQSYTVELKIIMPFYQLEMKD